MTTLISCQIGSSLISGWKWQPRKCGCTRYSLSLTCSKLRITHALPRYRTTGTPPPGIVSVGFDCGECARKSSLNDQILPTCGCCWTKQCYVGESVGRR